MFSKNKKLIVSKIEEIIANYFQGYLRAEPETLLKAFHKDTKLLSTENGNLDKTEMSAWLENLRERKVKGDIRHAEVEILGFDIAGDAAVVKTKLTFPKFTFTDYLSLLQIKSRWIIVNKIYSTQKSGETK